MLEARGSTTIDASLDRVFDFVADARNENSWLPGARNVRLVSPEPIGLGSSFEGEYARAGTVALRITEYERPHQLTVHGEAKGLAFDDHITFDQRAGGTQLTALMRTEPKGLFKLVAPIVGRVIGKQFQQNWDRLRVALEE